MGHVACSRFAASLSHSPSIAGEQAQRFAEVAFVQRDFSKAYGLLAESGKSYGSAEQFREFINQKHPSAFPSFVTATAYEPVPGQTKINIYIYGENGSEKFYYRMITEGSQERGYSVSGFDRKNIPYPQSDLIRPFN